MTNVDPDVMAAVKRKLNVTWVDESTDLRITDVVETTSPRLSSLLGFESGHVFSPADGASFGLFLNACLYEYSDAWDDFVLKYEREIQSERLLNVGSVNA